MRKDYEASAARVAIAKLCRSKPELELLLSRLTVLMPIVRQQTIESERKATAEYWASDLPTPEAKEMWQKFPGLWVCTDLIKATFPEVDTPEARELHSIGLAVAAFGGDDAISEIGWIIDSYIWQAWDGMAGHWL